MLRYIIYFDAGERKLAKVTARKRRKLFIGVKAPSQLFVPLVLE